MSTWTNDEVERVGAAEELELASVRRDGTLRRAVTMWVVRAGDGIYVRCANSPGSPSPAVASGATPRLRAASAATTGRRSRPWQSRRWRFGRGVAVEVLRAAGRPGWHQRRLRDRWLELTGVDLSAARC